MDPRLREFLDSRDGVQLGNRPFSVVSNQNLVAIPRFENAFLDHSFRGSYYLRPEQTPSHIASSSIASHGEDFSEDCDFADDDVLGYISQILMEEDMEDKTCMLQDSLELQAAEKSFYDLLGKKYPPSPVHSTNYVIGNGESPDVEHYVNSSNYASSSNSSSCFGDNVLIRNRTDYTPQLSTQPLYTTSQSSYGSSNSVIGSVDGLVDSPSSNLQVPDLNSESLSVWQSRKGIEESIRFLPCGSELLFDLEANGLLCREANAIKVETRDNGSHTGSRGRKHPYGEDGDTIDERRNKLAAVHMESTLPPEVFDTVLLLTDGRDHLLELQEGLQNISVSVLRNGVSKTMPQNGKSKGGRGRGKKQSGNKEVVDLRTLLINCAQAVAADDQRSANELLKQIRQHSSPFGDGNQRLADCFADGLEARIAGTGSQIYKGLVSKRTSVSDILKAYHLYIAACPFRKMSNLTSNQMIRFVAAGAKRLHVIDFGIFYGFQWPVLIQRLAKRKGGPPKLRITGIDFPQPGFRPAEQVEETGRRLENYARRFNVPFEYHSIAKKWETIQLEELKIDKEEFVVVSCLYGGKNLHDESVSVDSSRDIVLNLIRKVNPNIFIHGIVNGAFNAPFFVTRFREALFHYSALFDMLQTLVPREVRERMVIEKEIFGKEALNVIACEGWERVERPETYKQWQVRNLRAGFSQLPLNRNIVKIAMEKVRTCYHKDFVIDEDSRWLLQGWKGRIIYALSCWKPA